MADLINVNLKEISSHLFSSILHLSSTFSPHFIFFNRRVLLYKILWFSVTRQQESAQSTSMSPPSRASLPSPSAPHPHRQSRSPYLSSLGHTADCHWLSVLNMFLLIFMLRSICLTLSLLYPPPPLCPQVCSLCILYLSSIFKQSLRKVIWLHCLPACHVLSPVPLFVTLYPWNFPGKNTGGACHFLLQGIFPGPGIEHLSSMSHALQVDSLLAEPLGKLTWPASFSFFCINFN